MAAMMALGSTLTSCKQESATASTEAEQPVEQTQEQNADPEAAIKKAINDYMVNEIGKNYAPGQICIPNVMIQEINEEENETLVWGSFWVFNYNQAGDTLKTVSGGSHPGLMHLRRTGTGYEVAQFDAVGDGSNFEPTARKIFGDRYDAFQNNESNDGRREALRGIAIARYVKEHKLPVTMYQDQGWDPVAIPVVEEE